MRRGVLWFLIGFTAGSLAIVLVLWFTTGRDIRRPAGAFPESRGGAHRSEPPPPPPPPPRP